MNAELLRLQESEERTKHWKRWGPYLSERAWGTLPPAQGEIVQSGLGSGQYDGRSTWASAASGVSTEPRSTKRATAAMRREKDSCARVMKASLGVVARHND